MEDRLYHPLSVEHRLSRVEDGVESNRHRLDEVEKRQEDITDLVRSVAAIAQKQTDMDVDMKEIKADVKSLSGKPAKRWESVVEKALLTIVAALVGWLMVRFGLMV
ncbi:MAG: hypothetical protein IIX28_03860 [Clostridia bacterium]|nr:hypothetical protein [Clostridia bacterium]